MPNLSEKTKIIRELEDLCEKKTWHVPPGKDEDPLDYGVHSKDEEIKAWHIPRATGEFLFFLVSLVQPKHILELGTSLGYSTLWLGSAAENYGGHIDTVEYFSEKAEIARTYARKAGLEKTVTVHREKILDHLNTSETRYDFVFLDADKGSYAEYLAILKRKADPSCLLVVDNAGNFRHRMSAFIEACKKDDTLSTVFLPFDNGLLLVQFGKENANLLGSE